VDPDPDPAFQVNPDPDTDADTIRIQGFEDQTLEKKIQMTNFFDQKLQFTGAYDQTTREAFSPQRRSSSTSNNEIYVCGSFFPLGSGFGLRIRIRIKGLHRISIQSRSGNSSHSINL
jgi:hypothetical protein